MEWADQGLVLGARRHGETSVILETMTRDHGRYLGLVRGGRSRKLRPVLQPGNVVNLRWRARLDEHLGSYQVEAENLRAATLMEDRASLYCLNILSSHLRLLPEREAYMQMYDAANIILENAASPAIALHLIVHFELALLEVLGFGLSLEQCVVSGATSDLIWVSPKSGCAVSRIEGAPWADKLLPLPAMLTGEKGGAPQPVETETSDLVKGLELTGFFLERNVYIPRAIRPSDERMKLVAELDQR